MTKALEFASFLGLNGKMRPPLTSIQVRWIPPPDNWFKLNTYGSSLWNPGCVGGGGIIRNSHGDWVCGYARSVGYTTSVAAELWVLRGGINMCIDLRLATVEIELDTKLVVDLLQKDAGSLTGNDVILADCKECLKRILRVKIQHCFRKANKCANALPRIGTLLSQDFIVLSTPSRCRAVN